MRKQFTQQLMASLKAHKFTKGSITYFIKLRDVYDNGTDYTIGSAMGITKLGDNEEITADDVSLEVGDGIKNGQLARLRLSYDDTTDNNKSKTASIICPIDKAASAVVALLSKTYKGSDIKSAAVPRRRRLG